MTPPSTPRQPARPTVDRLAEALGPDRGDPLAAELRTWILDSSRFRAFAEAHREKIRKKLRGATTEDARRDVREELRTARLLLADRRIELAFEAYGAGRAGPDFTVTFRGGTRLNLEVTRLQHPTEAALGRLLVAKLRQLPPSIPNALLVAIEGDRADAVDVAATVRALRARVDARDETWLGDRGFDGARAFYDRFLRLGGLIVSCEAAAEDDRATIWTNGSARIPLPERAARACLDALRAH